MTALGLLLNEAQGFAIDATMDGGQVAVRDTTTPANNLTNVALNSSNLTQNGTSPKMVNWNSDPYLRWTPHNLVLQSQTFDTTWSPATGSVSSNTTTAPDGSVTADQFTQGATGELSQSVTMLGDVQYTLTFYVRAGTATWLMLVQGEAADSNTGWFNVATGVTGSVANAVGASGAAISAVNTGSGWYRVSLTGIPSAGAATSPAVSISCVTADAGIIRDIGATVLLWGGQWNIGPIATLYLVTTTATRVGIPQGYDVANSKFGILIEAEATNVCLRSEELDNVFWTPDLCTISANATTAPDGSATADKIVEDSGVVSPGVTSSELTPAVGQITLSIHAKAAGRSLVYVNDDSTANSVAWFNLSTGTVGSKQAAIDRSAITPVGNGWYRCEIEVTSDGTMVMGFGPSLVDGTTSYTGNGADGVYVWGAQAEAGSVATSYIPTVAATATRAADSISALTSTFPAATEWTTYAHVLSFGGPETDNYVVMIGTDDFNRSALNFFNNGINFRLEVTDDSVDTAIIGMGVASFNNVHQITGAFKTNSFAFTADGGGIGVDTSGTLDTTPTTFYFGFDGINDALWLNGYIYRMVHVPRRVIDAELPSWRYNFFDSGAIVRGLCLPGFRYI